MTTDILIEDARWTDAGLQALADRAVPATLAAAGLTPSEWEISLLACNDARIADLNGEYRLKSTATNVLSWPSEERGAEGAGDRPDAPEGPDPELGDIAIAFETCQREAAEQGKSFDDHVTHLLVHATLHLLGYDHIRDADAALMEGLETEILASMGIADPYE